MFVRRLGYGLAAVVVAAATVCFGQTAAQAAGMTRYPNTMAVRHGCSVIGAAAGGYRAIACADIFADSTYPYAGGEVLCARVSDGVNVECSGASQRLELWNYTKSRKVGTSPTYTCGYYDGYNPRCSPSPYRNYDADGALLISGCDQAYVIARTTVRLPGTNTVVSGFASTSNYRNSGC